MRKLLFLICLLCCSLSAYAATITKPDQVDFGVYPVAIYSLDPLDNSFNISFYAWWRTTDPYYHPESAIEIVNAREYSYKFGGHGLNKDGKYYTFVHYYAKINHPWNIKYFPFGRHHLQVRMEGFNDINSVRFTPDMTDSSIHPEIKIPGWDIIGMTLKKSVITYNTNFGDADAPRGLYDRLTMDIEIKRQGFRVYISYFVGFFMAGVLAHILYLMTSFPYPARATIFVGGIFSFVGNKYVIDQRLPLTSDFTLADGIQAATFVVLFIAILVSILLEIMKLPEIKHRKVSIIIGAISACCYFTYIAEFTIRAVLS